MLDIKEQFDRLVENGFNYEESLVRQNLSHDDVLALREKVSDSPYVPKLLYDRFLVLFINASKGNVDEAAKLVKKYCEIKITSPELFWNRNPESKDLQLSFRVQQMAALPITPDNCYLYIHRLADTNPRIYDFDHAFKMFMMMAEYTVFNNGPREGAIFISDWTGVCFGHLLRPSLSTIRKGLEYIQYASPLKMKAVHVLNSSHLIQIAFSMCKPFMRKNLYDLIHIHTSDIDYNDFFDKHVPRHCMPADYGGDLPLLEKLHEKNVEALMAHREYFHLEEQVMRKSYDETYKIQF